MSEPTPRSVAAGSNVLSGTSEAVPEPEPTAQHLRNDGGTSIREQMVCGSYTHRGDTLERSPSKTPSRRFWDVVMREEDDADACGPPSLSRMVKQGNTYASPPSSPVKPSSAVPDLIPWVPTPCKPIVAFPSPPSSEVGKEDINEREHQNGKPRKGRRRWRMQDETHTFVCRINGCDKVLERNDFTRVRAHVRFKHANDMMVGYRHYKCLFPNCDFESEVPMRIAEHICSQAHFDVPIPCCVPACGHSFAGRSWAMTRHRNDACVFCEGCNERFKDAVARMQHEATCPCIPQARATRNRRKLEIEQEEGGGEGRRRRRRNVKPFKTPRLEMLVKDLFQH